MSQLTEAENQAWHDEGAVSVIDQLQRDLAAVRADSAKYRAALETVMCLDEDEELPRGEIVCGREYDGRIVHCINCIAREALNDVR